MSNDLRCLLGGGARFAVCSLRSYDRALWAPPATWPSACTGRAAVLSSGSTMARRESHVVCHRHGALPHGRDRHWVRAHGARWRSGRRGRRWRRLVVMVVL